MKSALKVSQFVFQKAEMVLSDCTRNRRSPAERNRFLNGTQATTRYSLGCAKRNNTSPLCFETLLRNTCLAEHHLSRNTMPSIALRQRMAWSSLTRLRLVAEVTRVGMVGGGHMPFSTRYLSKAHAHAATYRDSVLRISPSTMNSLWSRVKSRS